MKNLAWFLILLHFVPTVAYSFQFDTWTSGTSSREALAIARDRDIPVVREGLVSINKHFDPNASTKYIDNAHDFYYKTTLLGKNAKVNLIFTPESKFLSAVRIKWLEVPSKDGFKQEVIDTLTSKYGQYLKKENQMFFETLLWAIDKTNRVSMRTGANQISVEYLDLTVHATGQKEVDRKKSAERGNAKAKDASKF
jgi:hypothetical protein